MFGFGRSGTLIEAGGAEFPHLRAGVPAPAGRFPHRLVADPASRVAGEPGTCTHSTQVSTVGCQICRTSDAERFDPPLVVRRFVTEREVSLGELLAEAARRLAGTTACAERALWHGGLHVNGHPLDGDAEPRAVPGGAWVAVYAFAREPEPVALDPARLLHDGDFLVAVDKPPWLPMQRTRATARLSLEAALRALLGDDSLVAVHRLDRQTSGVALFARGAAGAWASRELAARRVAKRYLALVAPPPAHDAFAIEGFLARAPDPARFRFALHAEPREAARWSLTRFRVIERRAGRALLEARPETGRTHQIRVHLAAAGTPVAGDALYGSDAAAARVLLHAASLELARPDGTKLRIEAPVPGDVRDGLDASGSGDALSLDGARARR
jgi:RluA family pseudouridine synthase